MYQYYKYLILQHCAHMVAFTVLIQYLKLSGNLSVVAACLKDKAEGSATYRAVRRRIVSGAWRPQRRRMVNAREIGGELGGNSPRVKIERDRKCEVGREIVDTMKGAGRHQGAFGAIVDGFSRAAGRMIRHADHSIGPDRPMRRPRRRRKQKRENREAQQQWPDRRKEPRGAGRR
ncbi:hypothetical protein [Rhodoblastus sp.]|uniref:hypothetical protein n=1 Tax=Rhodoblastus sp. TaxID=1962975 RepID=UPI0026098329|nr:hypothetical protein [Rhodoblastus sp.]